MLASSVASFNSDGKRGPVQGLESIRTARTRRPPRKTKWASVSGWNCTIAEVKTAGSIAGAGQVPPSLRSILDVFLLAALASWRQIFQSSPCQAFPRERAEALVAGVGQVELHRAVESGIVRHDGAAVGRIVMPREQVARQLVPGAGARLCLPSVH